MSDLFKREKRKVNKKAMALLGSDSGRMLTNINYIIILLLYITLLIVFQNFTKRCMQRPRNPAISEYFLKDGSKLLKKNSFLRGPIYP